MKAPAVWVLAFALGAAACQQGSEPPEETKAESGVFVTLETEIFVPHCARAGCHGGGNPAADLDLTAGRGYEEMVGVPSDRRPDRLRVDPGNPDRSYLMERLIPGGDTPKMPMGAAPLPQSEIDRIRSWIQDGAKK